MRITPVVLLALSLAAPCAAKEITAGEYVRLRLGGDRAARGLPRWVEGRVLDLAPGSVRLRLDDSREVTVPEVLIQTVDLRMERHSRFRGAAIGLGIGLGIDVLTNAAHPCDGEECDWGSFGTLAWVSLGTAIGGLVSPGYGWQSGRIDVAVQPAVRRSGGGLSLAVSF